METAGYDALWVLDAPTREKYSFMAVSAYLENPKGANKGNGKVIGEFTCDRIYKIDKDSTDFLFKAGGLSVYKQAAEEKCGLRVAMTDDELHGYLGHCQGYGWHISDLVIYDTPKELIEFHTWKKCKSCNKSGYESTACIYDENCIIPAAITKAPQRWCYVEELP